MQKIIDKTKRPVIVTLVTLLIVTIIDAFSTSTELGLATLILDNLILPILILSTFMSAYWVLLTDDFWLIYEGSDTQLWTRVKTGLKFLVWIPGMGLYFYAVTQGLLSVYNRAYGGEQSTVISGQIIEKHNTRDRYYFEIKDPSLERTVEITVDQSDYGKLNTGDIYRTQRKIGALGLLYEAKR